MFDRLSRVLAGAVGALLVTLTILVTFQVLGRYVPFLPRPMWTEEVSRWLLAWMVFLGAAAALRRSDHFVIDVIPRKLEARIGRLLQMLVVLAVIAISAFLLIGGAGMTYGGMTRISTASGLHLAWAFAAVPVGGLLMTLFSAELGWKVLRRGADEAPDSHSADGRSELS